MAPEGGGGFKPERGVPGRGQQLSMHKEAATPILVIYFCHSAPKGCRIWSAIFAHGW